MTKTKDQHQEHADAFNAAVKTFGGAEQKDPDPVLLGVVNQAKPGLTGPAPVVALALQLENGAAQTYVANTSALTDENARKVTASIMGVEAQHAVDPVRGAGAGRRWRRRSHRAAARRGQVAGRRGERRVPRCVLQDRPGA